MILPSLGPHEAVRLPRLRQLVSRDGTLGIDGVSAVVHLGKPVGMRIRVLAVLLSGGVRTGPVIRRRGVCVPPKSGLMFQAWPTGGNSAARLGRWYTLSGLRPNLLAVRTTSGHKPAVLTDHLICGIS